MEIWRIGHIVSLSWWWVEGESTLVGGGLVLQSESFRTAVRITSTTYAMVCSAYRYNWLGKNVLRDMASVDIKLLLFEKVRTRLYNMSFSLQNRKKTKNNFFHFRFLSDISLP